MEWVNTERHLSVNLEYALASFVFAFAARL
jgi:hypothetical protein